MPRPDPLGGSRWSRLWPADGADLALLLLAAAGLSLSLFAIADWSGAESGPLVWVLGPFIALHASSPVFFFLAGALYLSRRGRVIGTHRRWVWVGVGVTVPLWFLAGLPVTIRGGAELTSLVVPWNLLGLGLMWMGAYRTLRHRPTA